LRELYPERKRRLRERLSRALLGADARLDTFFFEAGRRAREAFERFSAFMDRFHVSGWRRWVLVEPLSEAATLGLGGLIVLLGLALPAIRETSDDDWLKKSELAVTFLDRYGNEIGSRGIKHNDAIPLDEFPDALIKATLATEDRRFYDHFGIDFPRTFRGCSLQAILQLVSRPAITGTPCELRICLRSIEFGN
jgi:penicillin-binding protein 1A